MLSIMKLASRRIPQSGQTIATLAMASTVLLVLPTALATGSEEHKWLATSELQLQRLLTDQRRLLPMIFITSFPNERERRQGIKGGAICYLPKPYDDEE
jgi:CheY-like chemotaxis protein